MLENFFLAVASSVVTSLVFGGGIAGVIVWLSKTWLSERIKNQIKSEYDQKLETHKAELKRDSDILIERTRSKLSISAKENELKFARLQERRAEVIAEVYAKIHKLYFLFGACILMFSRGDAAGNNSRLDAATAARSDLYQYYSVRIIFLPQKTAENLQKLDEEITMTLGKFARRVNNTEQWNDKTDQDWIEICNHMTGEIKNIKIELENEFRQLMGDNTLSSSDEDLS